MIKKIIWAFLDLITFGIGTALFVTATLFPRSDEEAAGIGAFMIILGFLLRNWKKNLFASTNNENKEIKSTEKYIALGVILIVAFTLCGAILTKID
jgi:hypothetical protein